MKLEIQRSQYINVRKLFKGGNYMRKYSSILCAFILVVPPKMEKKLNYDTFFVSNFLSRLFQDRSELFCVGIELFEKE